MVIKCLVENTSISQEYKSKHGLSIYIETLKHKILFDVGPNGLFLENAKKLGIDITDIDTVVISHGHADHGKGLSDELITGIAKELNALDSKFYTCHCTGTKAYQIMKNEMNGKLNYLSTGMVVEL